MSTVAESIQAADENPNRVVWQLAGPAVMLNVLQTINGFLDTSFIARIQYNGRADDAVLAAVAASMSVLFLFFSIGMALGTAPTAIVSRAYGAKNADEVKHASRISLGYSLLAGSLFIGIGFLILPFARASFVPSDAPRVGVLMSEYLGIVCLSLPALYGIQTIAGCLRATGDAKSPLVISGIQILLHICLNLVLILPGQTILGVHVPGAGLGVRGAAMAMTFSAYLALVIYILWVRRSALQLDRPELPNREWIQRLTRIAAPAAGMAILRVGSFSLLVAILSRVPNEHTYALGAMRVGIQMESIAFMPAFALMISAQALVGQSLGMGKPDRAARLGWLAAHHSAVVVTVVSLLMLVFAGPVVKMLIPDQPAETINIAVRYAQIVLITETLFSYGMVLVGAMQGAGDTARPFWMSLISLWIVRIPIAWVLAIGLKMGSDGVWIAMAVSQSVNGILAMALFKQGRWKTARV
ncbi:MAG: MATE family efflux transporter [Fimbriimonadaceae bacterium]|nr:MATE family efflux transporter [Fimbriimonadaceae bacterium]